MIVARGLGRKVTTSVEQFTPLVSFGLGRDRTLIVLPTPQEGFFTVALSILTRDIEMEVRG